MICGIEGTKGPPLSYQSLVRCAIGKYTFKSRETIIWQREQCKWESLREEDGELEWQELVKGALKCGLRAENVPANGNDELYIIYTSGTTNHPKSVLREAGGHSMGLSLSIRHMFGVKEPVM